MLEGYIIKDINEQFVVSKHSHHYEIDGKTYDLKYGDKVLVNSFDEIYSVQISTVPDKYVCGDNEMSVEDYNSCLIKLEYNNKNNHSLESYYELNRFKRDWTSINVTKNVKTKIEVQIIDEFILETGNQYIISEFKNGTLNSTLIYHREKAVLDIVTQKLNKLGFLFKGLSYNYYEETKNNKVYGFSGDKRLNSIVCFGKYLFSNDKITSIKGGYDKLLEMYNSDIEYYNDYIESYHKIYFGSIKDDEIDCKFIFERLLSIRTHLINAVGKTNENKIKTSLIYNDITKLETYFKNKINVKD